MNIGKWIGLISLIIALYILWQIRQLVLLLFTAVILANALNILVIKIEKWSVLLFKKFNLKIKLKRGIAVILALLITLAIFIIFFWLIIPPFVEQSQELTVKVNAGIEKLNFLLNNWIISLEKELSIDLRDYLPDINDLVKQLPPFMNDVLGKGLTFFSNSLLVLLNILLVTILTIMLLVNPDPYRRGFIRLFPSFYRRRVDEILVLCDQALEGWLSGIIFNMIFIGIFSFIGLLIIGIPLALAQGLVAGILNLIPNIGPALSVIPPMIIALLDQPWKAPAVLILYIIIQQVESNILTPVVMAEKLDLLPVVTLLAQIFFATFFGFFGLILALPLTVIGQILFKEILVKDVLDQWQEPTAKPARSPIYFTPITVNTSNTQIESIEDQISFSDLIKEDQSQENDLKVSDPPTTETNNI